MSAFKPDAVVAAMLLLGEGMRQTPPRQLPLRQLLYDPCRELLRVVLQADGTWYCHACARGPGRAGARRE